MSFPTYGGQMPPGMHEGHQHATNQQGNPVGNYGAYQEPYQQAQNNYGGYQQGNYGAFAPGQHAQFQQPAQNYAAPPTQQGYGYQGHNSFNQAPPSSEQAFTIPGLNGPPLNPLNVIAAGSTILGGGGQAWGSQYMQKVQQRMGWLSGGAFKYHFAISNQYVVTKLMILMFPFLKKWTFARQPEQIQGGHKYRPPRLDVHAPDLYIPVTAAWAFVTLHCLIALIQGKYKPDIVYGHAWYAGFGWALHTIAAWVVLRMMALPSTLPWVDLLAYAGYIYVPACYTLLLGIVLGRVGWWAGWAYGATCSAIFLVRTIKRVMFQEARSYGTNLTLTNYLLLALAALQYPLLMWLCHTTLPAWSILGAGAGVKGGAAAAAGAAAGAGGAAAKAVGKTAINAKGGGTQAAAPTKEAATPVAQAAGKKLNSVVKPKGGPGDVAGAGAGEGMQAAGKGAADMSGVPPIPRGPA